MKGIIGKKVGMTQIFDDNGNVIPVTVIQAGPCYVTQVRTADRDGYVGIQLGFGETKPQRLTKGQLGHLQRNNLPALKVLREFRVRDGETDVQEGQQITADVFAKGERVDVIGTSKGRGLRVASSAITSAASPRLTVLLTVPAPPVRLARTPSLAAPSKVSVWPDIWAVTV